MIEKRALFETEKITKSFGGLTALNNVSISIYPGEIHSIIGENGAGKSTLMNIISGSMTPTKGNILIDGKSVEFSSPKEAQDYGIAIAPQEINLVPELTVAENIVLGAHKKSSGIINWKKTNEFATARLKEIDKSIDPTVTVKSLSKAHQQLVQIARATASNARILIFDEPTATLTYREEEVLLAFIENLRNYGKSAFYISHRLEEVRRLSDRITVLRDGHHVGELTSEEATRERMVTLMAGRKPNETIHETRIFDKDSKVIFKVEGLSRSNEFNNVNFFLKQNEILGIYGLVGSGRTELAKCIFGATKADTGKISLDDKEVKFANPTQAVKEGLVYIPEERKQEGIFPLLSIAENTALPNIEKFRSILFLSQKDMYDQVLNMGKKLKAKFSNLKNPITSLSGGNQQKFIIARWLMSDAKVLIMDEPTRGIDVNAKFEIQAVLRNLSEEKNVSIIVISSEMEELLQVADRIMVMRQGKNVGTIDRDHATQKNLLELAMS